MNYHKTLLFPILLSAASLFAADTHTFELTPTFGKNYSDKSSKMTNSDLLYGLKGTWKSAEDLGVEVGFEGGSDIMYVGEDKTTSLYRVFAHAMLFGEEEYTLTPYAFVGAGYEFLSDNIQGDPDQGLIDGGVGFSYSMYPFLNISIEAKALSKLDTEDIDYTANVGFSFIFDENFKLNRTGNPFVRQTIMEEALD